jgi:hypothetical protein
MGTKEALVSRRQFIKYGVGGLTAIAVQSGTPLALFAGRRAYAQAAPPITLGMTTADVEMVDGIPVPHWLYTVGGVPTSPGPFVFAFEGEPVEFNVTNNIPGAPRRFAIVGNLNGDAFALVKETADIPFEGTGSLTIPGDLRPGTYLYKDPTADPISRVLGLHGVLVILPDPVLSGTNPYGAYSTANVSKLFAALGQGIHRHPDAAFPGDPWFATTDANPAYDPVGNHADHEHRMHFVDDDLGPRSPVFERFLYRSRIWLCHSIDPGLNRAVILNGNVPDPDTVTMNFVPQYFSINGRQGAFAMHAPDVLAMGTIGQPHLIRCVNAGLAHHSPHLHANHVYVTSVNNAVGGGSVQFGNPEAPGEAAADNIFFADSVTLGPQDRIDWLVPFIRPPDIPRVLGDDGLLLPLGQLAAQELNTTLIVPQNPMSWPMHSHMELDQTAAGGNYPQGAIAGWEIMGEFGHPFAAEAVRAPNRPRGRGRGLGGGQGQGQGQGRR